jgi:hypothetical protein
MIFSLLLLETVVTVNQHHRAGRPFSTNGSAGGALAPKVPDHDRI